MNVKAFNFFPLVCDLFLHVYCSHCTQPCMLFAGFECYHSADGLVHADSSERDLKY